MNDVAAQADYEADPALRTLLSQSAVSPTVHRDNAASDARRQHVHNIADAVLTEQADLFQRLQHDDAAGDDDNADDVDDRAVGGMS